LGEISLFSERTAMAPVVRSLTVKKGWFFNPHIYPWGESPWQKSDEGGGEN